MTNSDLTWEELKPLLMWLTMPCCGKGTAVRKDTYFPRVIKCKRCDVMYHVVKVDDTTYEFMRMR